MVFIGLTDQFAGALGFASALSLDWLLENEVDAIAAAVDGDPATKAGRASGRPSGPGRGTSRPGLRRSSRRRRAPRGRAARA